MAIYSCNISNVSRAKGSSSCANLAYITGETVLEDRTGFLYQYGRQDRIMETGTILPQNAPSEFQDPKKLFNAIESFETASNARTAKKIMIVLPREFDLEKQKEVVESYIKDTITIKGYACTYAIHHDKDDNNPHAHILIANRQIDEKGNWSTKSRKEYALDENNERIPQLDADGNQKLGKRNEKLWKRVSVQVNPLDTKDMLEQLRERWANECNKHLIPEQQIDHRSYVEQGKEEEPAIHEGYTARKIEAQGGISERCEINRQIIQRNHLLKQIQNKLKNIAEKIVEIQDIFIHPHKGLIEAPRSVSNSSAIVNDLEQLKRTVGGKYEQLKPYKKQEAKQGVEQGVVQEQKESSLPKIIPLSGALSTPNTIPPLKKTEISSVPKATPPSPKIMPQSKAPSVSKTTPPPRTFGVVSRERNDTKQKLDSAQNTLNYTKHIEIRIEDLNKIIKDCDEKIESKGYKHYNKKAFGLMGKLPFGEGQKWRNEQVARAVERKDEAMTEQRELFEQFKIAFGMTYKERSVIYDRLNEAIKAYRANYKKLDNEWQPLAYTQHLAEQRQREQVERERREARQLDMEHNPEKYKDRGLTR